MTLTADYPLTHPDRIEHLAVRRVGTDRAWIADPAPDRCVVEVHELKTWAKLAAAVLVCPGQCNAWRRICRGHEPITPLPGEHLVIGQTPGRAVYRVVEALPGTASVALVRVA